VRLSACQKAASGASRGFSPDSTDLATDENRVINNATHAMVFFILELFMNMIHIISRLFLNIIILPEQDV
jgi:hypothetical protein